jgi:hypothetical protein
MSINNVTIRTKEKFDKMKSELQIALNKIVDTDGSFKLVYQYLHNMDGASINNMDDYSIGIVKNVRKNERGDIICDVEVKDFLKLAINFTNEIDNFVVSGETDKSMKHIKKNTLRVSHFVIYDRYAKEVIKESQSTETSAVKINANVPSTVAGVIPKVINKLMTKEVNDVISKQIEEEFGNGTNKTE